MGILLSQSDAVATITLDRQEALNALTPSLLSELADTLDAVAHDPSVRVVVPPVMMLLPYNKEHATGSRIPSISTGGAAMNAMM